jgi:hypothetical protein
MKSNNTKVTYLRKWPDYIVILMGLPLLLFGSYFLIIGTWEILTIRAFEKDYFVLLSICLFFISLGGVIVYLGIRGSTGKLWYLLGAIYLTGIIIGYALREGNLM